MANSNSLTGCAAPGCKTMKASHLLMCSMHWGALPQNIKLRVYAGHWKMQDGESAREWLIARELARLHIAVRTFQPQAVQDEIEAEIERLEDVQL